MSYGVERVNLTVVIIIIRNHCHRSHFISFASWSKSFCKSYSISEAPIRSETHVEIGWCLFCYDTRSIPFRICTSLILYTPYTYHVQLMRISYTVHGYIYCSVDDLIVITIIVPRSKFWLWSYSPICLIWFRSVCPDFEPRTVPTHCNERHFHYNGCVTLNPSFILCLWMACVKNSHWNYWQIRTASV